MKVLLTKQWVAMIEYQIDQCSSQMDYTHQVQTQSHRGALKEMGTAHQKAQCLLVWRCASSAAWIYSNGDAETEAPSDDIAEHLDYRGGV